MGYFATLTSKGQITVPKEVRERLGLKEEDSLAFVTVEEGAPLIPRNMPVETLFGILSGYALKGTDVEDYDDAIRWAVADHVEGGTRSKGRRGDAA